MARPIGIPGHPNSGRRKGTPNKRTRELIAILDEHGYCPIADLIETAALAKKEYQRCELIHDAICDSKAVQGIRTPTQDTAPQYLALIQKSAAEIAPYLFPRRKAIEFNDPNGTAANTLTAIFKRIADSK